MRYTFGGYTLDTQQYELYRDGARLPLRPKALQVLVYLLAHRERVVSKDELLTHVWPEAHVGDTALSSCLKAIRRVLGDDGQGQHVIRTVRRFGYRFIAPVTVADSPAGCAVGALPPSAALPPPASLATSPVGRDPELTRLEYCFARALHGERHLVFITGEAGIGKTTLVEAFLARVATPEALWIAYGQCIEQYGAGEAYLPVLEAFSRLSRAPQEPHLVEVLHQYAPSWLAQLPRLLSPADHEHLQRLVQGTTQSRMLRELAEALELLTATHPFILVLEDLQWSDVSTLEWLAYVARRRDPARLLILGTYRPVEAMAQQHPVHPVAQELRRQGKATAVELPCLRVTEVGAYLTQRFGPVAWAEPLARGIHQRTSGHPFFMIAIVEALMQQGQLVEQGAEWMLQDAPQSLVLTAPETVRQLIEQQLLSLCPEDQALLEVASVAGVEFSAVEVAVGLAQPVEAIEVRCEALARHQQFVRTAGMNTWPDGTQTAHYSFRHALYQEVLYARLPPSQCRRLHQQIGLRKEAGYGGQARQMAAELAVHFVRGQETWRAVQYLHAAATNALQRSAYQEATTHLSESLALLHTLPETPERAQQEVALQLTRAQMQHATGRSGSPEVEQAYTRAWALCQQVGETPQRFAVLVGLQVFYNNRGRLRKAQEFEAPLLQLAQRLDDPVYWRQAHTALGISAFWRGDFTLARHHYQHTLALSEAQSSEVSLSMYGQPANVRCLAFLARTLGYLGYPDQAVQQSRRALAHAEGFAYPPSVVLTLYHATSLHHVLRDMHATIQHAEALITLATQHGFDLWRHAGTVQRDWALMRQGQGEHRLPQMQQSLQSLLDGGAAIFRPGFLLLLADAHGQVGQMDAGLALLTAALQEVEENGVCYIEAEIWRLQGEFWLRQATPETSRAATCFEQALAVARRQQAKWWELRAAMSLARLWQQQGKRDEAHQLLAPVYGWFTEGFDTADLQDAKALLAELGE